MEKKLNYQRNMLYALNLCHAIHTIISHISRTLQVSFNNTLQLWWPSCTTNIWMCHYYLNVAVNECIGVPEITHAWNLNGYVAAKTITRAFSEKIYKFSTDLSNIWLSKCSATYLCMRIYLFANIFYQKKLMMKGMHGRTFQVQQQVK